MKDKLISFFFNTVSLVVWAATIAVVVTAVVLLCTGMTKPPVFTLNYASVSPADAAVLAENGKEGDDWYAVELSVRVAASNLSPFTYTAEGFAVGAAEGISESAFLAVEPASFSFSKAAPQDVTITYYTESPAGAEALCDAAQELAFRFTSYTGRFTFLKFPFKGDLPGFTVSQFGQPVPEEKITLGEADPAA
jgi:hypothetical protein